MKARMKSGHYGPHVKGCICATMLETTCKQIIKS